MVMETAEVSRRRDLLRTTCAAAGVVGRRG